MKNAYKYNLEYEKTVVMIHTGMFVQTFDACAYVVCALTGYQLIEQKNGHIRCGFNDQSVSTVKMLLDKNHVSYVELQTSPSNEQATIISEHILSDTHVFDELKMRGEKIAIARQRASAHIEQIRNMEDDGNGSSSSGSTHTQTDSVVTLRSKEWEFVSKLCQGRHPFSGEIISQLDLDDPQVIRELFAVRDKLSAINPCDALR